MDADGDDDGDVAVVRFHFPCTSLLACVPPCTGYPWCAAAHVAAWLVTSSAKQRVQNGSWPRGFWRGDGASSERALEKARRARAPNAEVQNIIIFTRTTELPQEHPRPL